jgi:hypothetical protein
MPVHAGTGSAREEQMQHTPTSRHPAHLSPRRLTSALLLVAFVLLLPPPLEAASAAAAFRGKVITSAIPLTPTGEEASFFAYLRQRHQAELPRPASGAWLVHLIAFFHEPIGDTQCHVAFYRLRGKEPPEFVEAFGQQVTASQENLSTKVELSPERFTPGTYELRITRLVRGKEEVYARSQLTLK